MPPAKELKFSTYQKKAKVYITCLTHIEKVTTPLTVTADILSAVDQRALRLHVKEVSKIHERFLQLIERAMESEDEEFIQDQVMTDHAQVTDLVTTLLSTIEAKLPADPPPSSHDTSFNESVSTPLQNVRLPRLDLKTFSGDLTTWTTWFSVFEVSIHKNVHLNHVTKMQYLLSCLEGPALKLISSLAITSANYTTAIETLKHRYHNVRRLTTLHLSNLVDMPQISHTSARGMRQFVSTFFENSEALKSLECDVTSSSNPVLVLLLLRKLDSELRTKLEVYRSRHNKPEHSLPELDELIKFIEETCVHMEDATLTSVTPHSSHSKPATNQESKYRPPAKHVSLTVSHDKYHDRSHDKSPPPPQGNTCFACGKVGHKIYVCESYLSQSPADRHKIVKQNKRCFSCLGTHSVSQCLSKATCLKCNQKHHTTLHFERMDSPSASAPVSHSVTRTVKKPASTVPKGNSHSHASTKDDLVSASAINSPPLSSVNASTTVLLGTAMVQLSSTTGTKHTFRALLDTGSMVDFISERAAGMLGTSRRRAHQTVLGIGQTSSVTKGVTDLDVLPLHGRPIVLGHTFHILDRISADLPRTALSPQVMQKVKPYALADPLFHLPGKIDVLIGAALLPSLLTDETHRLGRDLPYVVGTRLGYIVMGKTPCAPPSPPPQTTYVTSLLSTSDVELHHSLQSFWQQEEPPTPSLKTEEEQLCDEHFDATHTRTPQGRYIVRLPFKPHAPELGTSHLAAERRLYSLENKFRLQPRFSDLYKTFMKDYLDSGHMSPCLKFDVSTPHYYLPHHGVLKESSSTTKLRTVFDASCKTSSGLSLNDVLLTGRKLQANICDILLNFRVHPVVFSCDIRQMYRQILVHPDDTPHQLILWRFDKTQPVETYTLNTVTYGVNSSPYLAIKTLQQLAHDEGSSFPKAAKVLQQQTYVDDIIAGAESVDAALRLQTELIELLKRGGFELRKWASNAPELLQRLPQDHLETPVFLEESSAPHLSILGLHWSPQADAFSYNLSLSRQASTKRQVLSLVAQIYDPCGFLAPTTMWAKCFLQLLWTSGLTWDEPLPPPLLEQWQLFSTHLSELSALTIPRNLNMSSAWHMELHGFCDASEHGYAAVVYLRCHLSDDSIVVRLLIAKTRVAPLKKITLPRLELCGAHLLGQLVHYCTTLFADQLDPNSRYLWCDSSVALTWLQTPPYRLKTFVANRVAQTQEVIPPQCWRHVAGTQNPADCASRGILASALVDHPLWWTGPPWLSLPSRHWPMSRFQAVPSEELEDMKPPSATSLTVSPCDEWTLLSKFSSWTLTKLVMAYILRFINNCRARIKLRGPLSSTELQAAQSRLFKLVQLQTFPSDLKLISRGDSPSLKLQRLRPFLDADGLLRVGGRLVKSNLSLDAKQPVLLPHHHHIVDLYIDYVHVTHLHAGPQLTQALLAASVWICSARRVIRSRIFKCVQCFRVKPRNQNPLMGDLPSSRVNPARPFLHSAMDYCGPIEVKVHNLKAMRKIKVYLCVFVCLSVKAVHLEVVHDLTTAGFIAALTRFVSRRGLCSDLYSDCGTNFVGAGTALKAIVQDSLLSADSRAQSTHFGQLHGITFHFNPPAAPHQGGLWESAVKSAKHHLTRVIGDTLLTLQELSTLVVQVEAMLNSRPLTPLSSDPTDLTALTPGHFLIGAPLAAIPEPCLLDVNINRLRQWQLVQAYNQRIWQRWQGEYLHTLQQRTKWTKEVPNLRVGDLVLIHTSSPPLTWPLARITALHPGKDGVVRVVDLKTSSGSLTRPVVKVFPLPIVPLENSS